MTENDDIKRELENTVDRALGIGKKETQGIFKI